MHPNAKRSAANRSGTVRYCLGRCVVCPISGLRSESACQCAVFMCDILCICVVRCCFLLWFCVAPLCRSMWGALVRGSACACEPFASGCVSSCGIQWSSGVSCCSVSSFHSACVPVSRSPQAHVCRDLSSELTSDIDACEQFSSGHIHIIVARERLSSPVVGPYG